MNDIRHFYFTTIVTQVHTYTQSAQVKYPSLRFVYVFYQFYRLLSNQMTFDKPNVFDIFIRVHSTQPDAIHQWNAI